MSDDRCTCCDLLGYSCGRAKELKEQNEAAAERRRVLALPGVVPAMHPAFCSSCGEFSIREGTPIRKHGDGWKSMECCA